MANIDFQKILDKQNELLKQNSNTDSIWSHVKNVSMYQNNIGEFRCLVPSADDNSFDGFSVCRTAHRIKDNKGYFVCNAKTLGEDFICPACEILAKNPELKERISTKTDIFIKVFDILEDKVRIYSMSQSNYRNLLSCLAGLDKNATDWDSNISITYKPYAEGEGYGLEFTAKTESLPNKDYQAQVDELKLDFITKPLSDDKMLELENQLKEFKIDSGVEKQLNEVFPDEVPAPQNEMAVNDKDFGAEYATEELEFNDDNDFFLN